MKSRSLIVGVIIVLLLLLFTFIFENKQALASDQKLVHGAGTLPHLTSAITLELGLQAPIPALYALRYDIGLGKRVQLGISGSLFGHISAVEVHSMFNVLKSADDRDFLSLYLNPSIIYGVPPCGYPFDYFSDSYYYYYSSRWLLLNSGVAYEHRFGNKRRFGLYAKAGVISEFEDMRLRGGWGSYSIDCRVGFQALLGKRFSIALEPEFVVPVHEGQWPYLGGWFLIGYKVALTLAF